MEDQNEPVLLLPPPDESDDNNDSEAEGRDEASSTGGETFPIPAFVQAVAHRGISCDECGVQPIVGTRYKAKYIYDYDICQSCAQYMDPTELESTYVPIPKPLASRMANQYCIVDDSSVMRASTLGSAASELKRNDSGRTCAFFNLFVAPRGANGQEKVNEIKAALASNTTLEILHLHMCVGPYSFEPSLADIAKGLKANRSIKRLFWCISQQDRKNASEETLHALTEMMKKNTTIEALYVKRTCHSHFSPEQDVDQDAFSAAILAGFRNSKTIQQFRLDTYGILSETNKQTLLDTVAKNPKLQRIYAEFGKDDAHRLELVLACGRKDWLSRAADTTRPMSDRWDVVLEARDFPLVEPVAAVYHVLRESMDLVAVGGTHESTCSEN